MCEAANLEDFLHSMNQFRANSITGNQGASGTISGMRAGILITKITNKLFKHYSKVGNYPPF